MEVAVNNKQDRIKIEKRLEQSLSALAGRILKDHGKEQAEVGLSLVDLETMQLLNRDYRGIDTPTDVLAFSLEEENFQLGSQPQQPDLLGDVVICVPRAWEQAQERGGALERELLHLAAHGLLHLLGYDHQNILDKRRMRKKEEQFLAEAAEEERHEK